MKKVLTIVAIIIAVIIAIMLIIGPKDKKAEIGNKKFITANPIDLAEIKSISKFRSCVGHDYSGLNVEGEKETLRSMKHYIAPVKSIKSAKVFAPFDGRVSDIKSERADSGLQVWLSPDIDDGWNFIFFHIDLKEGLQKRTNIKSGELIGFYTGSGENFDFALKKFGMRREEFASPFNYMTDKVLTEYAKAGITQRDLILTKEFRDTNPCPIENGTESRYDTRFTAGDRDEDWVKI